MKSNGYGNIVGIGDTIFIEGDYNYPQRINREAEIIWDKKNGVIKFKMKSLPNHKDIYFDENDFYGVSKFKLLNSKK